ncbi:MAG: acetylxylan esterase [Actinobacteria bacterium]|nr:acetylxylan esterase [Actinomycetota bacterium]
MALFDLPLDELRTYRPTVREPADFEEFWTETIGEARAVGAAASSEVVEGHLRDVEIRDVRFPGFAGDPVAAWLLVPRGLDGPAPAVVQYLGYGGGRGLPYDNCLWACAGFVQLVMDTRGQGSSWGSGGATPDPHGTGPAVPGYMTRGIDDPRDYYYRRVSTDAVRAVDHVRELDEVDPARVVVAGISQGGGIALAAAALAGMGDGPAGVGRGTAGAGPSPAGGVAAVLADVPFLCHFERAVGMTDADPYGEIVRYLAVHRGAVESVFSTLSYFDGVNMARRVTAPARVSAALLDQTCPPSTVFAAANALAGPVEMDVYPFNQHEGGQVVQWEKQVSWVKGLLGL